MKKALYNYTYTTLRYVHDITTGEFINVGTALFCANGRFVGAKCRLTAGRVHKTFPSANSRQLIKKLRHIQTYISDFGNETIFQSQLDKYESVLDISRRVLPLDDSSLQWSPVGSGRCADPELELDKLYTRLVALYDESHINEHRNEEDIWRNFKQNLEKRRLLQYFEPKTISVRDDELEFRHAWKNGKWNCLQPISFDLSSPNYIKDKAHKWLGQISSLESSNELFKLYLLVGKPQDQNCEDAFNRALSILEKIPGEKELFKEQDANRLLDIIETEINEHLSTK